MAGAKDPAVLRVRTTGNGIENEWSIVSELFTPARVEPFSKNFGCGRITASVLLNLPKRDLLDRLLLSSRQQARSNESNQ
jgi:hypothetical protein